MSPFDNVSTFSFWYNVRELFCLFIDIYYGMRPFKSSSLPQITVQVYIIFIVEQGRIEFIATTSK